MIKKHSNLVRQIVYAAFMVLFILMVERLRRNSANVEDVSSATEEVITRPVDPIPVSSISNAEIPP
ncbi:MAG: hypothetical protein IPN30_08700 [Flavobacteriales bacterium]|nr:hypothetical protein [Flavobacteriales bacterium]